MKLCECGCGNPTKLASKTLKARGWKKGEPLRFINGHNKTTKRPEEVTKVCGYCGEKYSIPKYRESKSKFCSQSCTTSNRNKKAAYPLGKITELRGYKRIKVENHPYSKDGFIFLHRHIIENHFGNYIDPKEYDIHHINEDKNDNRIINLVVIRHSAHMRIHALKRIRDKEGKFDEV